MKKAIFVIAVLLLVFGTQTAQAQEALKKIREHYSSAKTYIENVKKLEEEGEIYPVPEYFLAKMKQNLPGTGYHEEDVYMYYREEEVDEIYPPLYLDFATMKYNFAAREFYEEYLYDEQGHIQFIYSSYPDMDEGKLREFRFYFDKGRLFNVIVKNCKFDQDEFVNEYSGKTVPTKYNGEYQSKVETSTRIMKLFTAFLGTRHL